MAVPYLEHFLDSLETLPTDLQRNFTLMRDLDSKTEELVSKIDKSAKDYIISVNELAPNDRNDRFDQIHDMFEKAKVLSDDKVQLAMQTYEMVDKHIRRLDTELTKFDNDFKEKHISGSQAPEVAPIEEVKKKGRKADKTKTNTFNPKNVIKNENEGKARKKSEVKIEIPTVATALNTTLPVLMANSDLGLDMAVDPNEPTYCLCHQVSYGEMIGCDNADCPIEWFHFGCVGLTIKPKGKWFCPKCIVERKKK